MSQPSDPRPSNGFTIRDAEFDALRAHLFSETGITLGDTKKDMLCSRLSKRLRHHGLTSFADYYTLLKEKDSSGTERQEFINCLTTNKTDFFRESHHFDFLRDRVIPAQRQKSPRRLRIWCAASSTGEEPYTLAMMLREHCPVSEGWDISILASDIDTQVLAQAQKGIYDADRTSDVPAEMLKKYFLKGTGANAGKVAARPELKSLITFRQLNLIDTHWPMQSPFDVIFCRNVMIYFNRETQHQILEQFATHLDPEGYLFLGHSENLHWMADRYSPIGNTVYRLRTTTDTPMPLKIKPKGPEEHSIILGDVKATRGPAILKTLLGSCVSACLYDPTTGVGGMNHFSLPGVSDESASTRYGAYAMEMLITSIMKKGGDRNRLRAKVFGGAKVLQMHSEFLNVGARNAEFVLNFLNLENIPIDAQCLGGTRGLLVRFHSDTGRALAKPLPGQELPEIVQKEEQFGRELLRKVETPSTDDITLF